MIRLICDLHVTSPPSSAPLTVASTLLPYDDVSPVVIAKERCSRVMRSDFAQPGL